MRGGDSWPVVLHRGGCVQYSRGAEFIVLRGLIFYYFFIFLSTYLNTDVELIHVVTLVSSSRQRQWRPHATQLTHVCFTYPTLYVPHQYVCIYHPVGEQIRVLVLQ